MITVSQHLRKILARFASGRGGFSFAEILIVIVISTFLMGAMYTVLLTGRNSWEINRDRVEIQQEIRKGLDWIRKDLRQAGLSTVTGVTANGVPNTSIVFQTPSGVSAGSVTWAPTIQYSVNANQLIRTTGAATNRVIAINISAIQFSRTAANPSLVNISITGQKNTPQHGLITMTVTAQERMRN